MARQVSASSPRAINALRNDDDYRHNVGSPEGTPVVITYSFAANGDFPGRNAGLRSVDRYGSMSAYEKGVVRDALAEYESETGVHFIEVPDDGQLDFMVAFGADGYSWAFYPSSRTQDVVINREALASGIAPGQPAHWLLLHEIGHAMGLEHSFEGRYVLRPEDDNHAVTVMSYTDGEGVVRGLRPLDVAALRSYYGGPVYDDWQVSLNAARTVVTIRDTDSAHRIETVNYALKILANGGDDTLLGNRTDDTLDGGAGRDTLLGGGGNDLFRGGDGHDVVRGEGGDDRALGDSGRDTLRGFGGDDTLDGGNGDDSLEGGDGDDHLLGGRNDDKLLGGAGDDRLDGGGGTNRLIGDRGNDVLSAGGGDDWLDGGPNDDTVNGGRGNDVLLGEEGNDFASGSGGNDVIRGDDGSDTLKGRRGADVIEGGGGVDSLSGGPQNDRLFGGSHGDVLDGGLGDDFITGESGNDTIHAGGGSGNDTIEGGSGEDHIWLNNNRAAIDTISQVTGSQLDHVHGFRRNDLLDIDLFYQDTPVADLARQVGEDVWIDLGPGDRIILHEFRLGDLDDTTII